MRLCSFGVVVVVRDYLLESSQNLCNLPRIPTAVSSSCGGTQGAPLSQHVPEDCSAVLPIWWTVLHHLTLSCRINLSVAHSWGCIPGSGLSRSPPWKTFLMSQHPPHTHETPCRLLSSHCTVFATTTSRTHKHLSQDAHSVILLATT